MKIDHMQFRIDKMMNDGILKVFFIKTNKFTLETGLIWLQLIAII